MAQKILVAQTQRPSKSKDMVQKGCRFPGTASLSGPQLHEAWMLGDSGFRVFGKREVLVVAIGEGRGAQECMCT